MIPEILLTHRVERAEMGYRKDRQKYPIDIQSMSNQLNYSRVYNLNSRKFKVIENEKMIVVSDKNGGIIEIILF